MTKKNTDQKDTNVDLSEAPPKSANNSKTERNSSTSNTSSTPVVRKVGRPSKKSLALQAAAATPTNRRPIATAKNPVVDLSSLDINLDDLDDLDLEVGHLLISLAYW